MHSAFFLRVAFLGSGLLVAMPQPARADTPEQRFQTYCSACHALDHMLVGPSLVEIASLYRNDRDGFVRWCIEPGSKRPGSIEMPPMAHLGEASLQELYSHIMTVTEGKTEQKSDRADPYAVPRGMLRRPQVQRIFLPEASPAAIAVALPGDLSYCFDASECRLRYVWKGGFIEGLPYWKGNGSSLAKIDGEIVYREPQAPFVGSGGPEEGVKFLGYTTRQGLPSFRYRREGMEITETVRPLPDGGGVERHFEIRQARPLRIVTPEHATVESSTGVVSLTADQAQSFTLTFRWK